MKTPPRALSALLALTVVTVVSAAEAWQRSGGAEVSFTAIGPAGLRIVGKTGDLELKDDGQTLTVAVPLANLDTGISLRNKHMREKYLEVPKYPRAELIVPKAELKLPAAGQTGAGQANGTLKLHGKEKPVRFTYKADHTGAATKVDGALHLDIREYGIDIPSYAGVSVKPDVDVAVSFSATE